MTYFILEPYDINDSVIYLEVPRPLAKETREYIEVHTPYEIAAVVSDFVEKPEVTPLRRFLEDNLDEMLRRFWHTLWIDEDEFPLDDFKRLARKGDWQAIISSIWEVRRRALEAEAPHKVFEFRAEGASLSGGGSLEETGEVTPLEDVLARQYAKLEELVLDIERAYTAGRKILDQLPMRQEERS